MAEGEIVRAMRPRRWRRLLARSALGILLLWACSVPPQEQSEAGRSRVKPRWAWGPREMREEPEVIRLEDEVTRRLETPEDPADSKKEPAGPPSLRP